MFTSDNVGDLQEAKIRSNGSGLGAPWHLGKIEVTCSSDGQMVTFPFSNWIDQVSFRACPHVCAANLSASEVMSQTQRTTQGDLKVLSTHCWGMLTRVCVPPSAALPVGCVQGC